MQVSRKSLDRWIRAYRAGGFEALCPSPRRVLPRTEASVLELGGAKKENPERTAAQVARVIAAHGGWAPSERTLQRHFVREEIATPRGGVVHGRFEAEAPNLLWTGDVLHGPHVAGRKTYLFAFIDDHSRLIAGFRWGFSEDSLHLAEALKRAVAVRGVRPGCMSITGPASLMRRCPATARSWASAWSTARPTGPRGGEKSNAGSRP